MVASLSWRLQDLCARVCRQVKPFLALQGPHEVCKTSARLTSCSWASGVDPRPHSSR